MDPIGSYVNIGHQGEALLQEIWEVWSWSGVSLNGESLTSNRLGGFKSLSRPSVSLFSLPAAQDVENLVASAAPCPPVCCHALSHDDNRLTSERISKLQLNAFFYKSYHGNRVSSQQ